MLAFVSFAGLKKTEYQTREVHVRGRLKYSNSNFTQKSVSFRRNHITSGVKLRFFLVGKHPTFQTYLKIGFQSYQNQTNHTIKSRDKF